MTYRVVLLFLGAFAFFPPANGDPPSFADEELEFLEIEIVEALCADSQFRREIGASVRVCRRNMMGKMPNCTRALYQLAPHSDELNEVGRLSRDEFVSVYSDCLKRDIEQ